MDLSRSKRWRDQSGTAMVMTVLVMLVFLTLGATAILVSALDLKAANSDHTGHQSLFVAEAGIQRALNGINHIGVLDFQADIVNCWSTCAGGRNPVWGVDPFQLLATYPTLQYSVQITADPANPTTRGTLTSTGFGDSNSRRVIRVSLQRGAIGGTPGALYAAADAVNPQFAGNSFLVDGNDYDLSGNRVAGATPKPGISTRNDSSTSTVVGALNSAEINNVQGLGYSTNPATPSVMTTSGPSVADLNQMISDLLAKPHVDWTSDQINAGDTLGTVSNPQITYLTQTDVTVKATANGNASGAGILIANGSLTINGTFDFVGWIIVRGSTTIGDQTNPDGTVTTGDANILGSLWTGDFNIKIGGNANVLYSSQGIQLAGGAGGGGSVPAPMLISSWQEVY
jgi:hypothetical protein